MSIGKALLEKFFLNLLYSNNSNIAKDILIIPKEETGKNITPSREKVLKPVRIFFRKSMILIPDKL